MTPPEFVEESERQLGLLAETGKIGPYEKQYVLADGSRRWFLFAGRRLEPYAVVEYAIDVTDRREAEERYRLLFDAIDEGFCIIEMIFDDGGRPVDYRFLEVNAAFARQTGLQDAAGRTMRSLEPEHEEHWFEVYGRIAKTREAERFELPAEKLGAYYEVYAFPFGPRDARQVGILFRNVIDRKRAEEERELLSRELSHRVKNSLAVVGALARQTRGDTVDEFRSAFVGRLNALAKAHGLLLQTNWQRADLGALVHEAMAAYRVGSDRVLVEGPPAKVSAKQALTLSLIVHELGTNALKYGALSNDVGSVRVAWNESAIGSIEIRWRERDGPTVTRGEESGFGSRLIQRAVEYELGGTIQLDWAPNGLNCVITFPRDEPDDGKP
jgi:two-component system CheB/CheR fusion protein